MTDPTTPSTHAVVLRGNLARARASAAQEAPTARLAQAFNGRWTRRHWMHASLFATIGALLAAIVPAHSPRDERADAIDELSRMLLIGMEQAKAAESSLRALIEGGEDFPRMTVDLERLGETLERLSDIEQALWHLRIEPPSR